MLEELLDALSGVVRSEDLPALFPDPPPVTPPVAPPLVAPATHLLWNKGRPSWAFYGVCAVASAGVVGAVLGARASH